MSPSAISRISLATSPLGIRVRLLTNHELAPHAQLGRRQRHRLLRDLQRHALELEHHAPRLHHRHPPLRRPLALPHARLGWLLRDPLLLKNPAAAFPAALAVP